MIKKIFLFILISIVFIWAIGCQVVNKDYSNSNKSYSNTSKNQTDSNTLQNQTDVKSDKNNVNDDSSKENNIAAENSDNKIAIVYFGDSQALSLVGEERTVQEITPEILVNEIIKGPQDSNHSRTVPEETKLLGVEIKGKTAYVNFSKELKENHWGGSAGETFTIYSIVNTLVLQPNLDIEQVQILIEGETVETLAGHADISIPLKPNLEMVDMK